MRTLTIANPDRLIRNVWCAILAIFALYVVIFSLGLSDILKLDWVDSIINLLDRGQPTPYTNRVLLSIASDIIAFLTPHAIQDAVRQLALQFLQTSVFHYFFWTTGWKGFSPRLAEPHYTYRIVVCVLLMYASVIIYALTLYRLSDYFFPAMKRVAYATPLLGLLAVLPLIDHNFKLYDFPTLALSSLCLLYLCRQQWRPYLICFTLACLNKETAFLQTGLFVLFYGFGKNPAQRKVLIAQCVIYVAVFLFIRMVLVPVQGQNMWFTPLLRIAMSMQYFDTDNMLVCITTFWLLTWRWHEVPLMLRKCLVIFATLIMLYFFFGNAREYRIFFDAYPFLIVIAGYTLFKPLEKPGSALRAQNP